MNVDTFLAHWSLKENPFKAEEARDDDVYHRIMEDHITHPDFEKVFGSVSQPSTAVVFGEKGSGKTAIRLLLENRIANHNASHADEKSWVIRMHDLNPFIDSILHHLDTTDSSVENLKQIRLEDHMDFILSTATTELVDFLTGEKDLDVPKSKQLRKKLRKMSRQKRIDLAELALIYDRPSTSNPATRWSKIGRKLGVRQLMNLNTTSWTFLFCAGLLAAFGFMGYNMPEPGILAAAGLSAVATIWLGWRWLQGQVKLGSLSKRIRQDVRIVPHNQKILKNRLSDLSYSELESQPIPQVGDQDSRYDLFNRLLRIVNELGYVSMTILYDRVDEPAAINGDAQKMQAVIWPVFNNKFLQQNRIGIKLLLPRELGTLLRKEDEAFFQRARLDKQNLVEKLEWTGATLYDICSKRLEGCLQDDASGKVSGLIALFDESVTQQDLVDALDQMRQPRDAFKFLYHVIQEHCQNVTDENPQWKIPKLLLEQVRKQESQRVQDLHRGISPA